MRHLNYNHLLYFWVVASEGSIARASEVLHLTPQTISGQLKLLEEVIGEPLFHRVGRGLVLSDTGELVKQYADEIFALGTELARRVRETPGQGVITLQVGIVDSIPKLVAYRILQPALGLEQGIRIVCSENRLENLLAELAVHRLDLVLSDRPVPAGLNVKAYSHQLGASGIAFFASEVLAAEYGENFPDSLHGAPMLLPMESSALRRGIDEWFDQRGIVPTVVAEFDDSALMNTFGEAGAGVFPAPGVVARTVEQRYRATCIGTAESLIEPYYAISPERKLKHDAVLRITQTARSSLFG